MLTATIHRLKRAVHHRPRLYGALYDAATFNFDYARQRLAAGHYPSAYGGLWTDRDDYKSIRDRKLAAGEIDSATALRLDQWRREGFILFPGAIAPDVIERYRSELQALKSREPSPLLVSATNLETPQPYGPQVHRDNMSVRTVDDYFFCESARELLFDRSIIEFLQLVFDARPVLTQSLNFEHGSEQDVHQDTAFVRMNSPMRFAGAWIALEDIAPGSGELVYYPGSHHWPDFLFSGRFKHYDAERDGPAQLQAWYQWMADQAQERDTPLQHFLPARGDLLIWHAGLAHGGAPVTDPGRTRHSLVGHYCASGVRPLYHYYKPKQRTRWRWREFSYFSSYYS